LKIIAMEEAFTVPAMTTRGILMNQQQRFRESALADMARRLPDFTELRLKDMDEHGVDMQVLSLTNNQGLELQPDVGIAVSDAKLANDVLAETVRANPTRFAGLAVLPFQDPAAAVRELDRVVNQLGLSGVLTNGHTLGHYLDEPRFYPVWEALAGHDVPLYLHPGGAPIEWPVFEGRPELLGATYAWAAETGGHALRLITSGLFDRFPTAKVILGHMGELLPFHLSRLDTRLPYVETDVKLAKKPSEYYTENFWITTSGVMAHSALLGAVLSIGIDNIMFAVDYPYESTVQAMDFLTSAPLSSADLEKVAHGNAERLLRLA
jgi:2,3-dihydroxybenzoate decarboxylase